MIERPASVPKEGMIPAFDAGWNAHELGMDRSTVEVLAASQSWALLGYDCRAQVQKSLEEKRAACEACEGRGVTRAWRGVERSYLGGYYEVVVCPECGTL